MKNGLIAFTLALFATTAAFAQKGGASISPASSDLTIRVCNESGRNALSAVIYRSGGQWRSRGWYVVNNGDCQDIATSDNLRFYVFAEELNNIDYSWAGQFQHCVTRPGPYDEIVDPNSTQCRPGQDSVMFSEWVADHFGVFTWTLDP